jgi:hypothetical protein
LGFEFADALAEDFNRNRFNRVRDYTQSKHILHARTRLILPGGVAFGRSAWDLTIDGASLDGNSGLINLNEGSIYGVGNFDKKTAAAGGTSTTAGRSTATHKRQTAEVCCRYLDGSFVPLIH